MHVRQDGQGRMMARQGIEDRGLRCSLFQVAETQIGTNYQPETDPEYLHREYISNGISNL